MRCALLLWLTVALWLWGRVAAAAPAAAPAAEEAPERLFHAALAALQRGAPSEAIDDLELLADRGFVHPDASYDRALAYVERARSARAEPGDLGRAAAALAEVLELRPGDDAAAAALQGVRSEIARRRAREGVTPVMARPSLGRAVSALLPEDDWVIGAVIGSALLTLGLACFRFIPRPAARIGGAIAIFGGTVLLGAGAGLAAWARHYRLTSEPAVVVVPEARLLDESGQPLSVKHGAADVVPEGASLHVLERRGGLAHIEWGTTDGWVAAGQIYLLARP